MNRTRKAVLLSALVFPGAGQFYLKRTLQGWGFMLLTLAAVWHFASTAFARIQPLVDEILDGRLSDPIVLLERVHQQGQDGSSMLTLSTTVIVACWLASIADAWIAGRAKDDAQAAP